MEAVVDLLASRMRKTTSDGLPITLNPSLGVRQDNGVSRIEFPGQPGDRQEWCIYARQAEAAEDSEYILHSIIPESVPPAGFVDAAFQAILDRLPDPTGKSYYLTALANGRLTRESVFRTLVRSPEGRKRGIDFMLVYR